MNDDFQHIGEIIRFYPILSQHIGFFNPGYTPIKPEVQDAHTYLKSCASLYLHLLEGEISEASENEILLDVSCGRGGGADIINQHFKFKQVHACDVNLEHIRFGQDNYKQIKFKQCNAEDLRYKSSRFNYLINVSSLHCYYNKDKFFKEVKRVLKPGGKFLFADKFVNEQQVYDVKYKLNQYGFELTDIQDITTKVQRSCHYLNTFFSLFRVRRYKDTYLMEPEPYELFEKLYFKQLQEYEKRLKLYYVFKCISK